MMGNSLRHENLELGLGYCGSVAEIWRKQEKGGFGKWWSVAWNSFEYDSNLIRVSSLGIAKYLSCQMSYT